MIIIHIFKTIDPNNQNYWDSFSAPVDINIQGIYTAWSMEFMEPISYEEWVANYSFHIIYPKGLYTMDAKGIKI